MLRQTVADLIRKQRLSAAMSQERLAAEASISFEHLNRIENYHSMPSLVVVDRIARSLGFRGVAHFFSADVTGTL